jgi:antibiotic biosynthesis monooxygenase (ABM) superfamily enzyme
LGATDDSWAADENKVTLFYDRLAAYADVQDVLAEFERGFSTESAYTEWLQTALLATRFSAPDRFSEADFDPNYQMNYRFDTLYEVYEWADPQDPGRWMDADEADLVRQSLAESAAGENGEAAAGYSEPLYDENYQMWYRYDNVNGVYEWADTADTATDAWLSQGQVDALYAERAEQAEVPAEEVPVVDVPVVLSAGDQQFVAEFSDVMEQILADAFEAVPEAQGLSNDELRAVLADALGVEG